MAAPRYVYGPNQGLRNLLLGRVLLKADSDSGTKNVFVGSEFTPPYDVCACPGTLQWWSSGVWDATIVQPAAADIANEIEHSEDVRVVGLEFNDMHVVLADVLSNEYTVARGAYLALRPAPTVTSGVRFIQPQFVEGWVMDAPEDHFFPCILVMSLRAPRKPLTNVLRIEEHMITVRYYTLMDDDYSHDGLMDTADDLVEIISRDNYLGGTVAESHVADTVFNQNPGRNSRGGGILTRSETLIDWVDIPIRASRYIAYLAQLAV